MTKSVLIVDDEPLVARLFGLVVRAAGYAPRLAGSGEDALDAVRADPPDLLVTDLNMAGLAGDALAACLLDSGLKRFPVILLTADETMEFADMTAHRGIDDVMTKNVDYARFQARLTHWLETPFGAVANAFPHRAVEGLSQRRV